MTELPKINGGKRRLSKRRLRRCDAQLQQQFDQLRTLMEESHPKATSNIDWAKLGFKVWVMPPWYYSIYATSEPTSARLSIADLSAVVARFPRLQSAGFQQGGVEKKSGTTWSIGKGMLSEGLSRESQRPMRVIIHGRDWEEGVEDLTRKEFKRLKASFRLGRRRRDFENLRALYGTAVSVELRPSKNYPPFGCMTAHMPKNCPLTDDLAQAVGDAMYHIDEVVMSKLIHHLDYRLPYFFRPEGTAGSERDAPQSTVATASSSAVRQQAAVIKGDDPVA